MAGSRRSPEPMPPRITIRLDLAETGAEPRLGRIGPGKIALVEAIAREGSISAAARSQRLSYRRAWTMVDEMNRLFCEPVVAAEMGGTGGGSAHLTQTGQALLAAFRAIEARAQEGARTALAELAKRLR